MKKHIETLSDWIESREVRGYYTFTKEDIEKQFPSAGKVYIKTALYRLAAKAKIVSPWRNFYVIMPVEYSLKGVIPPVFYMDQLMSYLGKRYYVALLNAASFYGASHQRVQTFSLMVEQPSLFQDIGHTGLSTSGLYSGTCIGKSGFGGNLIFQNGGCRIKIQKDTV